jgi:hypothetical protein
VAAPLIGRPAVVVWGTYRKKGGFVAARKRMTVSTNKSGGWTLNLGGGQERQFTTKTEAVQFGAREGRASGHAQLVIKGRNGRIQSERTYGADPRRSTKG